MKTGIYQQKSDGSFELIQEVDDAITIDSLSDPYDAYNETIDYASIFKPTQETLYFDNITYSAYFFTLFPEALHVFDRLFRYDPHAELRYRIKCRDDRTRRTYVLQKRNSDWKKALDRFHPYANKEWAYFGAGAFDTFC